MIAPLDFLNDPSRSASWQRDAQDASTADGVLFVGLFQFNSSLLQKQWAMDFLALLVHRLKVKCPPPPEFPADTISCFKRNDSFIVKLYNAESQWYGNCKVRHDCRIQAHRPL